MVKPKMPRHPSIKLNNKYIFAFIAGATLLIFSPSLKNGFVWEDTLNLLENPGWWEFDIRRWFKSFVAGDYKPLVWASYSLDYLFWGLNPFGFHLSNLLFHALNAILLYPIILGVGRGRVQPGPAVFAVLFFSLHPLRVESVSWVTARKDVLFSFFYLLSLLSYLRYVEGRKRIRDRIRKKNWSGPRRTDGTGKTEDRRGAHPPEQEVTGWYLLSFISALGAFLSKGMAVSLPFILLLIDFYPFARFYHNPKKVVMEKIPFLVAAAAAGAAAVAGQFKYGALAGLDKFDIPSRLLLAGKSGVFYLIKSLWPSGLNPIYVVHPGTPGFLLSGIFSLGLMTSITLFCLYLRKKKLSWPLFSWLWYLITWFPISGIFQTGLVPIADRFTYLPAVGLSFALAFASSRSGRERTRYFLPGAVFLILVLSLITIHQERNWRNSLSLWGRMSESDSEVVHYNLGNALSKAGKYEEAIRHYFKAVRIKPDYGAAHYNLGIALAEVSRLKEAISHYRETLRIEPDSAKAHNNLGNAFIRQGKIKEATSQYQQAIRIDPALKDAHNNLANILAEQGNFDQATFHYREALRGCPDSADIHYNLAVTLSLQGDPAGATRHYRRALELNPEKAEAHYNLGLILSKQGKLQEARDQLEAALRLKPDFEAARRALKQE